MILDLVREGCLGHGPVHLLGARDPPTVGWVRPGLPVLSNLARPTQHQKSAIIGAWRDRVAADPCVREGFRGGPLLDAAGTSQLLNQLFSCSGEG